LFAEEDNASFRDWGVYVRGMVISKRRKTGVGMIISLSQPPDRTVLWK
jgi:hypothetical protein